MYLFLAFSLSIYTNTHTHTHTHTHIYIYTLITKWAINQWRTEGVVWGVQTPPRNTKLQLYPEPLTRGPLPPDPRSLCSLSSAEFVEPPPEQNY
jgi:hypothetical protein